MRSLATFIDRVDPDVLALCEIDAGDALALATRFARQWAYRGSQAIIWKPQLHQARVRDAYLPRTPLRPLERRGLLRVATQLGESPLELVATQIAAEREQCVRDLRYLRSSLRRIRAQCLLLAVLPDSRIGVRDLGFQKLVAGTDHEAIFSRGLEVLESAPDAYDHRGIGRPLLARVRLIPKA
ncbi:MAG: endonuclease/exonuclease/phosphatase family protein [Candidatus Eremiobacteraeota bacterium]|nr:endonuclease/exonuclease/phosphatase family protein [Candidatus Eremiobacteraeota bacterium]